MGTGALERGEQALLSSVLPCSVTILMFNSSRRSLVLVKQFRPGETSWVGRSWEGELQCAFRPLILSI